MNEIWKDILGYEGKYQASNCGRVRSINHVVRGKNHYTGDIFYREIQGKILKPGKYTKFGHLSVVLGKNRNSSPVHQLVMKAFVGEPPEGMEVLHINGIASDNRVSNLRYGNRTENILDVYRQGNKWRKLSVDDVYLIRFYFICGYTGIRIAKIFNVSRTTVSNIKNRRIFGWLE